MFISILFLALAGCSELEPPVNGSIDACLGGPSSALGGDDLEVEISGTVTGVDVESADMNLADCNTAPTHSIEITDEAGDIWTVGLSVDRDGSDETPIFAVDEGATIDLTFRDKMVWGTVSAFTLSDEDGLIAAVEEGTWGGALNTDDTPGLEVSRGKDVIGTESTDCMPIETYTIVFAADEKAELEPFQSAIIDIGGLAYNGLPVASYDYGDGTNCQVSDISGATSWVVYR